MSWTRKNGKPYRRHFFIRTVRNGRIRMLGRWWRPDGRHADGEDVYDGCMDGQRFAFGLYWREWMPDPLEHFCCLWGTEEEFFNYDPDVTPKPGPNVVNGTFRWMVWMVADA